MSLSPFDAIMPIKPTRPVEPGWRSNGVESDFRPALSRAYDAERPKPAPPTRPENRDEPPVERNRQDESPKLGSDKDRRSTPAAGSDESNDVQRPKAEAQDGDGRPDEEMDAVEVSAAGAAVAAVQRQEAQAEEVAEEVRAVADLSEGFEEAAPEGTAPEAAASAEDAKIQALGELPSEEGAESEPAEVLNQSPVGENSKAEGEPGKVKRDVKATDAEQAADETAVVDKPGADGHLLKGTTENRELAVGEESNGKVEADAGEKPRSTPQRSEPADVPNQPAPHATIVPAVEATQTPTTDGGGATPGAFEGAAPIQADAKSPTAASDRTASALERLSARAMRNSEKSDAPNGDMQIDRTRFVQRVEGAIRAAHQRDGKIQVRLSPPELGSLRIELAVQNGVMTAKVEAETPAARNVLLDSLPQLRERLAQQEIRVEKFDVDVRRDGGNANGGNPFEQPDGQSRDDRQHNRPSPLMSRISSTKSTQLGATNAVADGALDVRI